MISKTIRYNPWKSIDMQIDLQLLGDEKRRQKHLAMAMKKYEECKRQLDRRMASYDVRIRALEAIACFNPNSKFYEPDFHKAVIEEIEEKYL